MFLKKYKPLSSSLRGKVKLSLKTKRLEFSNLKFFYLKKIGRNNFGLITVRHKGGGLKFLYKVVNFFRVYKVFSTFIAYDKDIYRTAYLGLLKYLDGSYSYHIVSNDVKLSKVIKTTFFFDTSKNSECDTIPLGWIPHTNNVFNLELYPGSGGIYARSAGTYIKILMHSENNVIIKMPSKKILKISKYSLCSLGRTSFVDHKFEKLSKAGDNRRIGIKPTVRGEAMNPVDHPHGGRTRGGKPQMSPWGKVMK